MKRKIGEYTQGKPGPLLICVGGLHGNEWAGIQALDLIMKMLEVEPITNPGFRFFGKIIALSGNLPALKVKKRFIHRDLNRIWSPRHFRNPGNEVEFGELVSLKKLIDQYVLDWGGNSVYILDLHTTTAEGGIFLLPTVKESSIAIAETMHAPVILGLVERLGGTMIRHYSKREDVDITGLVFEAGQHDDPLSVNRAIAAITNCMRSIGIVCEEDIENRHDQLLVDYSKGLPKVAKLLYVHQIRPDDDFIMIKGFRNFDPVKKGDVLARDNHGTIVAKENGLMLMPHYQTLGDDGFFIVEKIR